MFEGTGLATDLRIALLSIFALIGSEGASSLTKPRKIQMGMRRAPLWDHP
jgi:hypothetical protein